MAQIWVDADACPVPVKEMLYRAATRTSTLVVFVANQALTVPPSPFIQTLRVGRGFDLADNLVIARVEPGDLVVTADIPLAAAVVDKGALALNPRGERYTADNIRGLLEMRNLMDTLRSGGMVTGGPPAYSQRDRQAFAKGLEQWLLGRAA